MKTVKYIALFSAAMLVLAGCAKKEQPFQPGEPDVENCYGVYFPVQDASGSHTLDPESERVITVTIARSQDAALVNEEITVPYTLTTSEDGIFQAGDITFASGQSETELEITFPEAKQGVNYSYNLAVTDPQYVSTYTAKSTSLSGSVLVVSWEYVLNPQTKEKAVFEFTQDWWGETAWAYIKYYEVDGVRTCFTETFHHEYINQAGQLVKYDDPGFWGYGEDYEWTFTWYTKVAHSSIPGATLIELPWQQTGYVHSSLGMIYAGDEINARNAWGSSYDWMKNATAGNFAASYYDGNGGFYFGVFVYTNQTGDGWQPDSTYDTIGIGEGFIRVNYSLSLESDYCSDGVSPIYVEAGADVASIKYAIYPGELDASEIKEKVAAISAGTEEGVEEFSAFELDEETNIKYATFGVSADKTGDYTLVAVGFNDKAEAQEADAVGFRFIAKEDEGEHKVELSIGAEEVPARYGEEYPANSSFAFYISGKDITEAHVGIYNTEKELADKEAWDAMLAELKEGKSQYINVCTEDELDAINSPGGLYTAINGLTALTNYTLIVWATNGDMETFQYTDYTTDGLPNVLIGTGEYAYADWFAAIAATRELELYQNPNLENTYQINGWNEDEEPLVFTLDPETNVIDFDYQYFSLFSGISIYLFDSKTVFTPATYEQHPEWATPSYYDPDKKTYNFHVAYYAEGYGVQVVDWETFTLSDGGAKISSMPVKHQFEKKDFVTMPESKVIGLPTREFKILSRDAKAVKANVTVSYDRKVKKSKRFEEPSFNGVRGNSIFE